MEMNDFIRDLGFDSQFKVFLAKYWEEILEKCQTSEMPAFMNLDFQKKYYAYTGGPDISERMETVLDILRNQAYARLYAEMLHYGLYVRTPALQFDAAYLMAEKVFGENTGVFNIMVSVSALPIIEKKFAAMGIPQKYAHDLAKWFHGRIQIFQVGHNGLPGMDLGAWVRHYIDGKLFRIGRFEYLLHTCPEWVPAVYRHKKTARIKVFCRNNWQITIDGSLALPNSPDEIFAYTTLQQTEGLVTGTPISPRGIAIPSQRETISLEEWEPVLSAWDLVPSIHIPGGGGMTMELVKESLAEARDFFPKYFNQEVKMFVCNSWILNPEWETEMPDSNMAKLLREVYMVTCQGRPNPISGFGFVFGRSDGNPLTYDMNPNNKLHMAFKRILESGRSTRFAPMFVMCDDIEKFGTQYYRNNY